MNTFLSVIILCVIYDASADELSPSNCQILTRDTKKGHFTFLLRIRENPKEIRGVKFEMGTTNIFLYDTIPTYVDIHVGDVNNMPCSLVGEGVVVTYEISAVSEPLTIWKGGSASIHDFETKKIQINHRNRDFLPVNVKVFKGTTASTEIVLTDPALGAKTANIELKEGFENWFVVPKKQLNRGRPLEMTLKMAIGGHVIITNLEEVSPMIFQNHPTTFTCFAKRCAFGIMKKAEEEKVFMEVELYSDPGLDVPQLEIRAKIHETIKLQMGEVQIIKYNKDELNMDLDCIISSTLKDVRQPPTILIFNSGETDMVLLKREKNVIISRPPSGTFYFDPNIIQKNLKLELLETSTADQCNLRFGLMNPLGVQHSVLHKSIQLTKTTNEAILNFSEDPLDTKRHTLELELLSDLNSRSSVRIELIDPCIQNPCKNNEVCVRSGINLECKEELVVPTRDPKIEDKEGSSPGLYPPFLSVMAAAAVAYLLC